MSANFISDKGLIFRLYTDSWNSKTTIKTIQFKSGQKIWTDISKEDILYKWSIRTLKEKIKEH